MSDALKRLRKRVKATTTLAKTKRRKVWVNEYEDGKLSGFNNWTKKNALAASGSDDGVVVPFIELRRGDVVLSREDVARAERLLDEADNYDHAVDALKELRALRRRHR